MTGKVEHRLPTLLPVSAIQSRLGFIFPAEFPDRSILVGEMAARVLFVFLYGGFVRGGPRLLRPSHIYFFTADQAEKTADSARTEWAGIATRPGYRPSGSRWYADTSRESIRDDLIRNRLLRLGIVVKKSGEPITSSKPVYSLSVDFARLLECSDIDLPALAAKWRSTHLDAATLQRMALRADGIAPKSGDVLIDLPDGTRIRISGGPSSLIAKGLIEDFAKQHLSSPAVLWLSASDRKSYPQFEALSAGVGLHIDVGSHLPDLILVDLATPTRFYFCEIVATDGAVTDARKQALLSLVRSSKIPDSAVRFVSAFEDRESAAFRKNFSKLATDSWVWFRTEAELRVILETSAHVSTR